MTRAILLFAHSDGDGHLAAEQSRRNLIDAGMDVRLVVDPQTTRSWRFWTQHLAGVDFGDAETVYFVDIMFGPKDPLGSYHALCARARSEPERHFVFIDHHAVPGLPAAPRNLEIRFVDSVYRCCVGAPSELMVVASICDADEAPVRDQITEQHRRRARGLNRAVTERALLAGTPVLNLLKCGYWNALEQLAEEPAAYHRTMYGNRIEKEPSSPLLQMAYAMRPTR